MSVNLKPLKVSVKELVADYENLEDEGVTGYGGRLNIRPPYQREFVYKPKQQEKVIDTILKQLHLNTIYWAEDGNGNYEVLDGQQRIMSICEYVKDDGFAVIIDKRAKGYDNLDQNSKDIIMDHKLMVFVCEGSDDDKMDWFETINTGGEKLTQQEILNAVYVGPFVMDAKRHFAKKNCVAVSKGARYLPSGGDHSIERQGILHTALKWLVKSREDIPSITHYMDKNRHGNAKELWGHFEKVIDWINDTFTTYNKQYMERADWGEIYEAYKNKSFNPTVLEQEIQRLLKLKNIDKPKEIWPFVLKTYGMQDEDKKPFISMLAKRLFSEDDKLKKFDEQGGVCPRCTQTFGYDEMEGDHDVPYIKGGASTYDNLVMLCRPCNRGKSSK